MEKQYEMKRCQKTLHENYILKKLQDVTGEPLVSILMYARESCTQHAEEMGEVSPEYARRSLEAVEALNEAIKELDKTLILKYKNEYI